jgi:hypothetical protein
MEQKTNIVPTFSESSYCRHVEIGEFHLLKEGQSDIIDWSMKLYFSLRKLV